MADFERTVAELQASLKVQCNDCAFSKDCKKRIALGIKLKKEKSDKQ